jgi:hypothetical protein
MFARTCSKLFSESQLHCRDTPPAALTTPISWSSNSLCCSKKDFSPEGAALAQDDPRGLLVLDDILDGILEETRWVFRVADSRRGAISLDPNSRALNYLTDIPVRRKSRSKASDLEQNAKISTRNVISPVPITSLYT